MGRKEFFIGADSDGTVFDSMTVKHKKAFIPALIEVWGYESEKEKVYEICENINLYSKTRGIDRFSGLELTFRRFEESGIKVPDFGDLKGFLNCGKSLSNSSLREYLKTFESGFLKDVLRWSEEADEKFMKEMKGLMPFEGVKKALKKAADKAEIAVISSASEESLMHDWKKDGLCELTDKIFGQEFGKKSAQLKAAAKGFKKENALMIGDAPGDYKEACAAEIGFYPITPGKEEECWKLFEEKYLDLFFGGGLTDKIKEELLRNFFSALE